MIRKLKLFGFIVMVASLVVNEVSIAFNSMGLNIITQNSPIADIQPEEEKKDSKESAEKPEYLLGKYSIDHLINDQLMDIPITDVALKEAPSLKLFSPPPEA